MTVCNFKLQWLVNWNLITVAISDPITTEISPIPVAILSDINSRSLTRKTSLTNSTSVTMLDLDWVTLVESNLVTNLSTTVILDRLNTCHINILLKVSHDCLDTLNLCIEVSNKSFELWNPVFKVCKTILKTFCTACKNHCYSCEC